MDSVWKWSLAAGAAGLTIIVARRVLSRGVICKSTAQLNGKTVLITGANCGIGKATAQELVSRGARLILACRDLSKGERAARDITSTVPEADIVVRHLDLASFNSIRKFATGLKDEPKIDILINNAGVFQCPFMKTEDGFEMQMGVNHIGHFYLTHLLLDKLKDSAPSRIIVVSSALHKLGKIDFEEMIVPSEVTYSKKKAYSDSKLANCLFARELSDQLDPAQVSVMCVHPGMVRTNLARHIVKEISVILKLLFYPFYWWLTTSPFYGCQTVVYCAVAEELTGHTGCYFGKCQEEPWSEVCKDNDVAKRLWDLSSKLTGIGK